MSRGLGRAVCGGQLGLWKVQDEDATQPILDECSAHARRAWRRARRAEQRVVRDFLCFDCGFSTHPEYYMVRDEIWTAANLPPRARRATRPSRFLPQFLCIGCLERRIDRRLNRADFSDAPTNDLDGDGSDLSVAIRSSRSARLYDRLSSP